MKVSSDEVGLEGCIDGVRVGDGACGCRLGTTKWSANGLRFAACIRCCFRDLGASMRTAEHHQGAHPTLMTCCFLTNVTLVQGLSRREVPRHGLASRNRRGIQLLGRLQKGLISQTQIFFLLQSIIFSSRLLPYPPARIHPFAPAEKRTSVDMGQPSFQASNALVYVTYGVFL
jgi:hypothetical protein